MFSWHGPPHEIFSYLFHYFILFEQCHDVQKCLRAFHYIEGQDQSAHPHSPSDMFVLIIFQGGKRTS